jgi:transposase-like protein
MLTCPSCHSEKTVKNGHIHNGKQRFKCCGCPKGRRVASALAYRFAYNRQFVENPEKITISQEKRELIDRLLLERISLAGISRVVKVSERWLQTYVNKKYALVSRTIQATPKKKAS